MNATRASKLFVPAVATLALLGALGPIATSIYQPSIPAIVAGLDTPTSIVQSTFSVRESHVQPM